MQKLKNKKQNHTSHSAPHTSQKGITLIALIITIIVMLILVGVTINVALNGGLFQNAEDAAKQMQIELDKETLQQAVIASLNDELRIENAQVLLDNLPKGWQVTGKDRGPYTCTSPTKNIFTVDEKGKIIYEGEEDSSDENSNNLQIEVSKNYNAITDVEILTITPKVTKEMFTEEQAVEIVAKQLFGENSLVNTLAQFDLELYNSFIEDLDDTENPLYGLGIAADFKDLQTKLSTILGKSSPSEQEISTYLFQVVEFPAATVEELAAYIYVPTNVKAKICKEGEEWKDITPKDGANTNKVKYTVTENGTYTIEIEMEGKIASTNVDVNSIGKKWTDNGNGQYTREDKTITIGSTKISNQDVKSKLGITTGNYNGNWTVIGIEGDKLKLVSVSPVAEDVIIGKEDPRAIEAVPAQDESSPTEEENFKRANWSYINAIETLDNVAKEATGVSNARCLTAQDILDIMGKENNKTEEVYNYYYNSEDGKVYSKYKTGIDENGNAVWSTPKLTSSIVMTETGENVILNSERDQITVTYSHISGGFSKEEISKLKNAVSIWTCFLADRDSHKESIKTRPYNILITDGEQFIYSRVFSWFDENESGGGSADSSKNKVHAVISI